MVDEDEARARSAPPPKVVPRSTTLLAGKGSPSRRIFPVMNFSSHLKNAVPLFLSKTSLALSQFASVRLGHRIQEPPKHTPTLKRPAERGNRLG